MHISSRVSGITGLHHQDQLSNPPALFETRSCLQPKMTMDSLSPQPPGAGIPVFPTTCRARLFPDLQLTLASLELRTVETFIIYFVGLDVCVVSDF